MPNRRVRAFASHRSRSTRARIPHERICKAITVHAQIEEEIFYPAVREALEDDELIEEALAEHAEAKELIAQIEGMEPSSGDYDASVKALATAIDEHVLEEREEIFLRAQAAPLDLRALALQLPLEQAPEAYANFDARKEGWTKVLKPGT